MSDGHQSCGEGGTTDRRLQGSHPASLNPADTRDLSCGEPRTSCSDCHCPGQEPRTPLENPAVCGLNLSLGLGGQIWRYVIRCRSACAGAGLKTLWRELDPYLLLLSYLFTSVVCQILSWAMVAG